MKIRNLLFLTILILQTTSVLAIYTDLNFQDFTRQAGELIYSITSDDYSLYFFVIIILTIFMKGIYTALLAKVKIFEGGGGEGINRYGNMTAWCFALLTVGSVSYYAGERSVSTLLQEVLGPFGIYGAIVTAAILYLGFRKALDSHPWALVCSGAVMFVISNMARSSTGMIIGIAIGIIGLFYALSRHPWMPVIGRTVSPSTVMHDEARVRDAIRDEADEARHEYSLDEHAERRAREAAERARRTFEDDMTEEHMEARIRSILQDMLATAERARRERRA